LLNDLSAEVAQGEVELGDLEIDPENVLVALIELIEGRTTPSGRGSIAIFLNQVMGKQRLQNLVYRRAAQPAELLKVFPGEIGIITQGT
jgi:hypothetical protein